MNRNIDRAMREILLLDADAQVEYIMYKAVNEDSTPRFDRYFRYKISFHKGLGVPSLEYSGVVETEKELLLHLRNGRDRLKKDMEMSKMLRNNPNV